MRTLALVAMTEANWNGSRSIEAVEVTNAQALTAVMAVALAATTKRLTPKERVLI
jgi:hypothetical protein